ncbi:MAG: DUF5129 domain-containing protein [Microbacterium sp.]|nr:DUF5129 domain-containing protein [Microbacterium sp.]
MTRPLARIGAVLVGTLVFGLSMVFPALAAQAVEGDRLVVEDTAGVLYLPQIESELAKVDFYEPTTVVVYTYRGQYDDNMNEKVLAYARSEHPEWITADGQKWADGLFIFVLDPDGRSVGTYFGDDRSVPLDDQNSIQDAAKEDFRSAFWTEGVISGVTKASTLINRPWYKSPGFIGASVVTGVAGAGTWIGIVAVRSSRRDRFARELARGDQHLTAVTMDLDMTELSARTLPADSSFAQRLEQRFHDFSGRYYAAVEDQQQLQVMTKRERSRSGAPEKAKAFADETAEMDFIDDAIVNAAALLTRSATWEKAWAAQVEPVREDVAAISSLIADPAARPLASAQALESFRIGAETEIERLGAGLREQSITPEAALEGLESLRAELSRLLREHSRALIEVYATSNRERESMEAAMERERRSVPPRSGVILDTVYGPGQFWNPISFGIGYSAGVDKVESARAAAASSSSFSSGSSTGYGSSGGSFSGSGSSSHF